ncbi:uncharacterized protein PSFLO_06621 [Pseudozyma flocculosa]|uniref:Secreted protein n=1 Tax=Pseudozyma flocculosa TaxID=84751 RepID=A0A5C3FCK5_9BASI|nr:uncharacterized protein PSFLO_06621 [Pseudozyma flocculosa]
MILGLFCCRAPSWRGRSLLTLSLVFSSASSPATTIATDTDTTTIVASRIATIRRPIRQPASEEDAAVPQHEQPTEPNQPVRRPFSQVQTPPASALCPACSFFFQRATHITSQQQRQAGRQGRRARPEGN